MARPTDWYKISFDSDPTPGDWQAIDRLGRSYTTFANNVDDVHTRLSNMQKCGPIQEWKGLSATEFKKQLGDLPGQLDKLFHSYQMAGKALTDLASSLHAAQKKADTALTQAQPLWKELQQKKTDLPGLQSAARTANRTNDKLTDPPAGQNVPKPDPEQVRIAARNAGNANTGVTDCSGRIHALEQQLGELHNHASRAHDDRRHAIDTCADQLGKASEAGIHNKHWWEKAWDFIADNWHFVISALKIIVAIGGIILLFVPGLNVLMILVLAAALIVLADTIVKACQGKAGWGDVLLAAMDCIPVAGKLGLLVKLGEGLKGMSVATRMAGPLSKLAPAFKKAQSLYKWGDEMEGLKGAAAGAGKGFIKDYAKSLSGDALNGKGINWGKDAFNAGATNILGGAVKFGASTGLNKFAYSTPVINTGSPGHPQNFDMLDHLGKGTAGNEFFAGGLKGLTTSVVKEAGNDLFFGGDHFDSGKVATGTLTGAGGNALGAKYTGDYTGPR